MSEIGVLTTAPASRKYDVETVSTVIRDITNTESYIECDEVDRCEYVTGGEVYPCEHYGYSLDGSILMDTRIGNAM